MSSSSVKNSSNHRFRSIHEEKIFSALYIEGAEMYQGQFMDGLASGMGTLIFRKESDKKVFEGKFFKGKMHGPGCLTMKDDTKKEGQWSENVFIETPQNGTETNKER